MGKGLLEKLGLRRPFPTIEAFRTRVAGAIEAVNPNVRVEPVGDESLETYFPDVVKPGFINLARSYEWCREHPRDLEALVQQTAELALGEPAKASPGRLVVLVRPKTFDPGEEGESPALVRPLVEELVAIVAVDTPDSYVFTSAKGLREELGLDDEAIWARAVENTRKAIGFEPAGMEAGKIGEIISGVGLASSLLADETVWDSAELTRLGPLVIAPIERDKLVFAALADTEAVDVLKRWHARQSQTSDWLTDLLIVRRNGRWEVAP